MKVVYEKKVEEQLYTVESITVNINLQTFYFINKIM